MKMVPYKYCIFNFKVGDIVQNFKTLGGYAWKICYLDKEKIVLMNFGCGGRIAIDFSEKPHTIYGWVSNEEFIKKRKELKLNKCKKQNVLAVI